MDLAQRKNQARLAQPYDVKVMIVQYVGTVYRYDNVQRSSPSSLDKD